MFINRYFVKESPESFTHMMKIDEDCLVSVETVLELLESDPDIQKAEPYFIYGDVESDRM